MVSRSLDGGSTWTAATPIDTDSGVHSNQGLATDGMGTWLVVWERSPLVGDPQLVVSRSTDAGATWTNPAVAADLPNHRAAISPDLATDGAGNWVAVWASLLTPPWAFPTMLISRSFNNGVTWTRPKTNGSAPSLFDPTIAASGIATMREGVGWAIAYNAEPNGGWGRVYVELGTEFHPQYQLKLDPTQSYLFQAPTSADVVPIRLPDYGLYAGDKVRLIVEGDFDHDAGDGSLDDRNHTIAVFSATDELAPNPVPPDHDPERVTRAMDLGLDEVTLPTATGSWTTDIGQHFAIADAAGTFRQVTVTIPLGASYLFVAAHDSDYTDNTDPDHDYAIRIMPIIPIPALPGGWMAVMLCSLAVTATALLRRRSHQRRPYSNPRSTVRMRGTRR